MNAEYLLDAIGLLDDGLIREAEEYRRPRAKHNYGLWLGWAASFAVVIALGYGVTHFGMGGGSSMAPSTPSGASTPAASTPAENGFPSGETTGDAATESSGSPSSGGGEPAGASPNTPGVPGNGCEAVDSAAEIFGMESGQTPAIMVDGALYWYAEEEVVRRPDESGIRYSTSYTGGTPEEDGQINFPREHVRYIVLEDGRVGVNWSGSDEWKVFSPVPPGEQ